MVKGWRNEGQGGAMSGVPGLEESEMRFGWKGRAGRSAEGVGKTQKYQDRPNTIGQAEGNPTPGGLQAGGGPGACCVTRPPEIKR